MKLEKYKVETTKGTLQYNISGNGKPKTDKFVLMLTFLNIPQSPCSLDYRWLILQKFLMRSKKIEKVFSKNSPPLGECHHIMPLHL
ncbi:hypothetical protein [Peribacillus frigoritolerans]|uniref:hypothetical protein n=1 Tax=Peribacillus frigoritolerans TaxID=450367 RepID=UPI0039A36CC7